VAGDARRCAERQRDGVARRQRVDGRAVVEVQLGIQARLEEVVEDRFAAALDGRGQPKERERIPVVRRSRRHREVRARPLDALGWLGETE